MTLYNSNKILKLIPKNIAQSFVHEVVVSGAGSSNDLPVAVQAVAKKKEKKENKTEVDNDAPQFIDQDNEC